MLKFDGPTLKIPVVQISVILTCLSMLSGTLWSAFTVMRDVQEGTRQNTLLIQQIQESQKEINTYSHKIFLNGAQAEKNAHAVSELKAVQAIINARTHITHTEFTKHIVSH